MKTNLVEGEVQAAPARAPRRWRALARFGLAATAFVGGYAEVQHSANALASITAVNAPANTSGLKPAVRLNPPKPRVANHEVYWIGDSQTVGVSQAVDASNISAKEYAASLGIGVTFNAHVSRSLYMGCDLPNARKECAVLSDGYTELQKHAGEVAAACTSVVWLGANAADSDEVFSQKIVQSYQDVQTFHRQDPAQSCPADESIFVVVTVPYGPKAPASFINHMNVRRQIVIDDLAPLHNAAVVDLQSYVTANGVLNGSTDGVHGGSVLEGRFVIDQLYGIINSLN